MVPMWDKVKFLIEFDLFHATHWRLHCWTLAATYSHKEQYVVQCPVQEYFCMRAENKPGIFQSEVDPSTSEPRLPEIEVNSVLWIKHKN